MDPDLHIAIVIPCMHTLRWFCMFYSAWITFDDHLFRHGGLL